MIFRLRLLYRIVPLIGLLMMAGLWLMLFFVFNPTLEITRDFSNNSFYILPIIIIFECILGTAWFGWMFFAANKATLVVQIDYMEYKTIRNLGFLTPIWLRSFRLEFKDITFIRTGKWLGQWEISNLTEKPVNMIPLIFGKANAEKFLELFQKHIPADRIQDGLVVFEPKKQKGYKLQLVLGVLLVILTLLTLPFDNTSLTRSWLNEAWQTKIRLPSFDSAWAFSAESTDAFWILTSDFGHPYRVYNQKPGQSKTWDLPELAEHDFPAFVSGDQTGNPIVWFDDKTMHYLNNNWETTFYRNELEFSGMRYSGSVIEGAQGWFVTKQDERYKFITLNAITGQWSEIPIPESALQEGFVPQNVRKAINGDLIVLSVNESENRVFIKSDASWLDHEYRFSTSENQSVRDYFLANDGFLWVLVGTFKNQQVEKVSLEGNVKITHLSIPEFDNNDIANYTRLTIDSHNRIWSSGGYPNFMAVFTPVWGGDATKLVMYTPKNSSYQSDASGWSVYFIDEEILSADDRVVSINTNTETLPAPLPDWFTRLNMNVVRLIIFLLYIPIVLYSIKTSRNPNYNNLRTHS